MGTAKEAQTSNDDQVTARPSGDEAVRCDPPPAPADHDGTHAADEEEPGYGYGV